MYKQLIDHFKKTVPEYPEEDLNNIVRYFEIKKVSKGDTIVKAGSVCRNGYFVVEGCFRYFIINSDGLPQIDANRSHMSGVSSPLEFLHL